MVPITNSNSCDKFNDNKTIIKRIFESTNVCSIFIDTCKHKINTHTSTKTVLGIVQISFSENSATILPLKSKILLY